MKKLVLCGSSLLIMMFLLSGCAKDANPLPSKSHPEDWTRISSSVFHGKKVLESGKASCTGCHGYDLSGGEAGTACHSCHELYPHVDQWMVMTASQFHGLYIAAEGWSMKSCQNCHGVDYRGGSSNKSCLVCHSDPGGPEACNTCHGSRKNAAPPKDLGGNLAKSAMGVGAHQVHLDAQLACSQCHVVPETMQDGGHIDGTLYAEVKAVWEWNHASGTCAKACHTQSGKTYIWNQ